MFGCLSALQVLALSLQEAVALAKYPQQIEQWGWRVAAITGPGPSSAVGAQQPMPLKSSPEDGPSCGSNFAVKLLQVPMICGVRLMGLDLQVSGGVGIAAPSPVRLDCQCKIIPEQHEIVRAKYVRCCFVHSSLFSSFRGHQTSAWIQCLPHLLGIIAMCVAMQFDLTCI
jgi:hypothetical protein